MSNPYPLAERYRHVAIERLDGWVHSWWVCAHERRLCGAADLRLAASAALRLRHGARAACKRLREERDEARQHFAEERETALEIRDEQRAAERERDAARLELRALEWLVVKGYPHWISRDDTTRIVHGHTGPDWQTVARALGWEG